MLRRANILRRCDPWSCRKRNRGFEVIDFTAPMSAYNHSTGKTLDFPFDDHRNAEAVSKSRAYRALVGEAAGGRQTSVDGNLVLSGPGLPRLPESRHSMVWSSPPRALRVAQALRNWPHDI
jgi:hypothetical protein